MRAQTHLAIVALLVSAPLGAQTLPEIASGFDPALCPMLCGVPAKPAAPEAEDEVVEDELSARNELSGGNELSARNELSGGNDLVEEEVNFDDEEDAADAETQRIISGAGGGGGGGGGGVGAGIKLFVDMLVDYRVGQESFVWRPNHTYVFVLAPITDTLNFIIHVSDDPVFFELEWQVLPDVTLKAGKLLVPFGTNNFHHIIGGRVDAESLFLPETWGDYGLSLKHLALDTEWMSAEYELYAINGFQGEDAPTFAAGTGADNNFWKGLGIKASLNVLGSYIVTGSAYYDVWDAKGEKRLLFYALGGELRQGFLPLPVLDRLRLRGEWARGEIEIERNLQTGLIAHEIAHAGFYYEAQMQVYDNVFLRLRGGRINPDNTVKDENDLWLAEPAVIWWTAKGKLQITLAYQALVASEQEYKPDGPSDVLYAKFFLQF